MSDQQRTIYQPHGRTAAADSGPGVIAADLARQPALSTRRAGLLQHVPALVIFVLASILLTWPLTPRMDDTLLSWGDPVFQAWTIAWDWHAIATDVRGIFDANIFYPWRNTLAYSDHLLGQTLTVLPVIALTGNGILADNIAVLLAFCLSGLAMYLLVYDLTGNRGAGIVAGIAYAFAPSRMAHLEHLHLLSAQWPPLALLFLRRSLLAGRPSHGLSSTVPPGDTDRTVLASERHVVAPMRTQQHGSRIPWLIGLGAVFFAQGLFGVYFFYFTIIMLVIAGGTYAFLALVSEDWHVIRSLALAAVACGIAGVLLVPTLMPYLEVHEDLDIERSTEEVSFWSARPSDYLAAWPGNRAWNEILAGNHRHIEQALFPGLLVVALAIVGLTNRRGGRERWVLLAVTLSAAVLSFGLSANIAGRDWPLPYRVFYDYLPGFRAIRVPARMGLLALVGLGGLAGLGLDHIWRLGRRELPLQAWYPPRLARSPRLAGMIAVTAVLVLLLAETVTRMELPDALPEPPDDMPAAYAWIREHPAPTLELPMGDGPVASAWPNFWSMMHWNQVVNGYSGIVPPTYYPFRERMKSFPSYDSLWLLQGIGIENVIIHEDFPDQSRDEVEARIEKKPQISLALDGPDAVYQLERNPWMWRLADTVPGEAAVDLPNAASDPVAFGLLMAVLQRDGHDVTGHGQVDYFTFPEADSTQCYVILRGQDDPAAFGYLDVSVLREEPGMVLYQNMECR